MNDKNTNDKQPKQPGDDKLHKKLDTYEKLAELPQDRFSIMRIRKDYVDKLQQDQSGSGVRRANFVQGLNAGIHKKEDIDKLNHSEQQRAEQLSKEASDKAKTYYHQNFSLPTKFNPPAHGKGAEKERDNKSPDKE